jgi:hypothetical protein
MNKNIAVKGSELFLNCFEIDLHIIKSVCCSRNYKESNIHFSVTDIVGSCVETVSVVIT